MALCTGRPWKPGLAGAELRVVILAEDKPKATALGTPQFSPGWGDPFVLAFLCLNWSLSRWEHTDFLSIAHSVDSGSRTSTLLLQNRVGNVHPWYQPRGALDRTLPSRAGRAQVTQDLGEHPESPRTSGRLLSTSEPQPLVCTVPAAVVPASFGQYEMRGAGLRASRAS